MHYQIIDAIVSKLDPELSAAEAHGMATGMISINNFADRNHWLQEVLQNAEGIEPNDQTALESLFNQTYNLLVNEDFEFAVFLPDDSAPMHERLEALRHWCQGYLFGMGSGTADAKWPLEVLEIIRDISELTKLDSEAEDEEAENDFVEITEYVKAGVIFINTELNPIRNSSVH